MFPSEKDSEWEPFKVNRKPTSQPSQPPTDDGIVQEEPEFVEDFETEEGAVWPLTEGRITNWSCFFGLLSYVHSRLGPHLHSPILLVAQPCWTSKDYERLTMFFFEKFKPPGFTIIDSATASLWAYNVVNACIVDVGLGKVDVTAITDFAIHTPGRGIAIPNCGGEAMTQRLLELLSDKGFSRDMCEQLKHSPICEVLLPGVPLPGSSGKPVDEITNPAAAASTGAVGSGPGQRHIAAALGEASMLEPGEEDPIENEGVLDVASIVTAGEKKMEEFLARKEREKAERAATRKKHSDAAAQTAARPAKMRNSERAKATFLYEDRAFSKSLGEANGSNGTAESQAPGPSGENAETSAQQADPKVGGRVRREVEVGVERLQVAGEIVDRIADAIHLAISSVDDVAKRSDVWDNLILVGNGAKVRGTLILV
jgi:actin-related protein 9